MAHFVVGHHPVFWNCHQRTVPWKRVLWAPKIRDGWPRIFVWVAYSEPFCLPGWRTKLAGNGASCGWRCRIWYLL